MRLLSISLIDEKELFYETEKLYSRDEVNVDELADA